MSTTKPKTFIAGGQRFTVGQRFTSRLSVREGMVWVVEDSFAPGLQRRNKVWAYQEANPGVYNVFEPENITVLPQEA